MTTIRHQRTNANLDVYVYQNTDDNSIRVTQLDGTEMPVETQPVYDGSGRLITTIVKFPDGETMELG